MRITLEPTTKEQLSGKVSFDAQYPKVIIEYPYDHIDIVGWLTIFRSILLNVGFGERAAESLTLTEEKEESTRITP